MIETSELTNKATMEVKPPSKRLSKFNDGAYSKPAHMFHSRPTHTMTPLNVKAATKPVNGTIVNRSDNFEPSPTSCIKRLFLELFPTH